LAGLRHTFGASILGTVWSWLTKPPEPPGRAAEDDPDSEPTDEDPFAIKVEEQRPLTQWWSGPL
jgi:hypothetical protein